MQRTARDYVTYYGPYGPGHREGVITEHADLFTRDGGTIRDAASGSGVTWAVLPDGAAYPFLCSDLVRMRTEDGQEVVRCGQVATRDGSCEAHAAQHDMWRGQSEWEVIRWERDLEDAAH